MTRIVLFLFTATVLVSVTGCKKNGKGISSLSGETDTLSYCFGYNIAKQFSEQKNQINAAMLGKAFRDFKAGSLSINEQQAGELLQNYGQKVNSGEIKKVANDEWYVTGSDNAIENLVDSVSYAIGSQMASGVSKEGIEVNSDVVEQAIWDFKEKKTLLKENDVRTQLEAFSNRAQLKQMEESKKAGAGNLIIANEWLEANKTKPGVKVHESGLQYKVIRDGAGKSPTLADQVTIHYRGTLTNGEEFDSSIKRGEPATFPLANLIQAWQIALPMMKEGAKWEIYVPPSIGYGEMGSPPTIGPNAALVFEIELFKVSPAPPPQQGQPQMR